MGAFIKHIADKELVFRICQETLKQITFPKWTKDLRKHFTQKDTLVAN